MGAQSSVSNFGDLSLGDKCLSLYRSWVKMETVGRGRLLAFQVVVDDLARRQVPVVDYRSYPEISADLKLMLELVGDLPPSSRQRYAAAKLKQSVTFIEQINSDKLLTHADITARGSPWMPCSDAVLNDFAGEFHQRKIKSGLSAREINQYLQEPLTQSEIVTHIDARSRFWLERLKEKLPYLPAANFVTKPVCLDESSIRNLVTCEFPQFKLLVNTAPHLVYTRAATECLSVHEVSGHIVHLTKLAQNQVLQNEYPFLLALAIHTQDAVFLEGVAQYLSCWLIKQYEKTDSLAAMAMSEFNLAFAVRHKNIFGIVSGTDSIDDAVKRHQHYLAGDGKHLRDIYERTLADKFFACMVFSYHASYMKLKPALNLSPENVIGFLEKILTDVWVLDEVGEMVMS